MPFEGCGLEWKGRRMEVLLGRGVRREMEVVSQGGEVEERWMRV